MALAINTPYADGDTVTHTNLNALVTEAGDGAATFNASQGSHDFVVKSSGNANMLKVDGTNDKVVVGGDLESNSGAATFNTSQGNHDFVVKSAGNANMLKVDGTNNAVGIGGDADSSGYELKVTGDALTTGNTRVSGKLGVNRDPDSTYTVAIDGDLLIQDTGDNFPAAVFTGSTGAAVQLNDTASSGSVFNLSSNIPGGGSIGEFSVGYIDKDEASRTAVNVTNVSVSGSLATITTDSAHDLVQHEHVILSGFSGSNATSYNKTHVVAEVTSTTVFKVYIGVTVGSFSGATATRRVTYAALAITKDEDGSGTNTVAYTKFSVPFLPQSTSEPSYLPDYCLWIDTTSGDNIVKCKLPS